MKTRRYIFTSGHASPEHTFENEPIDVDEDIEGGFYADHHKLGCSKTYPTPEKAVEEMVRQHGGFNISVEKGMMTILNIALDKGAENNYGAISASEFERLGLPFFAGCQDCGASLGCYNAYPTRTGMIGCADCTTDDMGFKTVEEFDKFHDENAPDAASTEEESAEAITFSMRIDCSSDDLSNKFGSVHAAKISQALADLANKLDAKSKPTAGWLSPGNEGRVLDEDGNIIGGWIIQ